MICSPIIRADTNVERSDGGTMYMKLAGHEFEGPLMDCSSLKGHPGVFAVITVWDGTPVLMDVDSGPDVKKAVKAHPRKKAWRHLSKPVGYAFVVQYQTKGHQSDRETLVSEVRDKMDVPCGN